MILNKEKCCLTLTDNILSTKRDINKRYLALVSYGEALFLYELNLFLTPGSPITLIYKFSPTVSTLEKMVFLTLQIMPGNIWGVAVKIVRGTSM